MEHRFTQKHGVLAKHVADYTLATNLGNQDIHLSYIILISIFFIFLIILKLYDPDLLKYGVYDEHIGDDDLAANLDGLQICH